MFLQGSRGGEECQRPGRTTITTITPLIRVFKGQASCQALCKSLHYVLPTAPLTATTNSLLQTDHLRLRGDVNCPETHKTKVGTGSSDLSDSKIYVFLTLRLFPHPQTGKTGGEGRPNADGLGAEGEKVKEEEGEKVGGQAESAEKHLLREGPLCELRTPKILTFLEDPIDRKTQQRAL